MQRRAASMTRRVGEAAPATMASASPALTIMAPKNNGLRIARSAMPVRAPGIDESEPAQRDLKLRGRGLDAIAAAEQHDPGHPVICQATRRFEDAGVLPLWKDDAPAQGPGALEKGLDEAHDPAAERSSIGT